MDQTVCVLAFRPYKYYSLARRVTTYYQLIPADVFYLSPYATTQYHHTDKIPRSVTFRAAGEPSNVVARLLGFLLKFLEFYTVFYHLFRNAPSIIHVLISEVHGPALMAVYFYAFYKKAKVVLHLDKAPNDKELDTLTKCIADLEADNAVFLTSDAQFLRETKLKQELFTEINGFLHFDQPMINRVNLLTTSAFAQPERTAIGIRTLFEYFEYTADGMIRGHQNTQRPTLVAIPCSRDSNFQAVEQFIVELEKQARGRHFVVVLSQAPARRSEQFKEFKSIIKMAKSYYAPKTASANKFINEKKPFENVFVSYMMFTDMDFDLFLDLCNSIVVFDDKCLRDLLCLRKTLVAFGCKSAHENVLCMDSVQQLAECVIETSQVDLKPNADYSVFEDIMKQKIGYEAIKAIAFEQPYAEQGCGCGGCGGCGGCDDKKCDGCDGYCDDCEH